MGLSFLLFPCGKYMGLISFLEQAQLDHKKRRLSQEVILCLFVKGLIRIGPLCLN